MGLTSTLVVGLNLDCPQSQASEESNKAHAHSLADSRVLETQLPDLPDLENGRHGDLLVVSPYCSRSHLLDLRTVSRPNQLLAKSLSVFEPVSNDYATAPYHKAFNWNDVISHLRRLASAEEYPWTTETFYIIVFRSQLPPSTDRGYLRELDEKSHEEAMASGGLLKYWFGEPDAQGRNLATCVWRERGDAKPASTGEGHRRAMSETIKLYTEWKVERLLLSIDDNIKTWNFRSLWDGKGSAPHHQHKT